MKLTVYLSGEIHTDWREEVAAACEKQQLDITFLGPVTDHGASDGCGVAIMGDEPDKFWYDHKGAKLNAIRTRTALSRADVVVVRFGQKYKQWNAAFDAGFAIGLSKSLIVLHTDDTQHALKEIDASASAVASTADEVVKILQYTSTNKI